MLNTFKRHRTALIIVTLMFLLFSYTQTLNLWQQGIFRFLQAVLPNESTQVNTAVVELDNTQSWTWSEIAVLVRKLDSTRSTTVGFILPVNQSHTDLNTKFQNQVMSGIASKHRDAYSKAVDNVDPDQKLKRTIQQSKNLVLGIPFVQNAIGQFSMGSLNRGIRNTNKKDGGAELHGAFYQFAMNSSVNPINQFLRWTYDGLASQVLIDKLPLLPILQSANTVGLYQADRFGINQSSAVPLVVQTGDQFFASLALQTAANFMTGEAKSLSVVEDRGVRIGRQFINTNSAFHIYPNLTLNKKGETSIPSYSAQNILANKININKLRNKAIVIGYSANRTLNKVSFSNTMHTAHVVNAITTGNYYTQPFWATLVQRGLIIGFALYLLLIPYRLRGRLGLAVSAFLAFLLINTSLLLLLIQSIWVPLLLPAVFIVIGHLIVTLYHHVTGIVGELKFVAAEANRKLASTLQLQGKLDIAFEYLQKCELTDTIMEDLYKLGLEFERRRQFNHALSLYDYMGTKNNQFRDIEERRKRYVALPENKLLASPGMPSNTSTIVLDNPQVERPILGRYEVEEVIGKGAMGTVYKGTDPKISRTVAIKTVALSEEFELQQLDDVKQRFFREAETAGRLHHPNIVTIYDAGEDHDLAYIAMEYVQGIGLDNYTHNKKLLAVDEVFKIGEAVATALEYAHGNSVVHRDVKPANIIYNQKQKIIKMTDFGIACLTDNNKTRTGMVLGSPSYMSPEQLSGKKVDGRSDLYSLAVTLYQLFTGTLPFTADTMASLAFKITNEKAKSVRKIRSDLPTCITRIINKAMEKDPKQRYQSGSAMADALRRCG